MQATPRDEGPVGAVPKSAKEHGAHERKVGTARTVPVAAERYVQVVAQPGRERDVPAAPEVREPHCRIRETEIVRHRKAETQRRADRGSGVAGEIAEDLPAE